MKIYICWQGFTFVTTSFIPHDFSLGRKQLNYSEKLKVIGEYLQQETDVDRKEIEETLGRYWKGKDLNIRKALGVLNMNANLRLCYSC